MIDAYQIQLKYNNLYSVLRYYLWDMNFIQTLGNLEISIYQLFPDINTVKKWLNQLYRMYRNYNIDDEELSDKFQNLLDIVNNTSDIFAPIYQTTEVVTIEDNKR